MYSPIWRRFASGRTVCLSVAVLLLGFCVTINCFRANNDARAVAVVMSAWFVELGAYPDGRTVVKPIATQRGDWMALCFGYAYGEPEFLDSEPDIDVRKTLAEEDFHQRNPVIVLIEGRRVVSRAEFPLPEGSTGFRAPTPQVWRIMDGVVKIHARVTVVGTNRITEFERAAPTP